MDLSSDSFTPSQSPLEPESKLHSQIPFLILEDRRISYIPFKFINEYRYSQDELYLSNIEAIIPTAFRKNFLNLERESSGIKIQEEAQVIINGEGYILLVHVESYIFPEFEDGIRYIVFVDNWAYNEDRESYILYNLGADIIEDASEGFLDEF